MVSTRRSNRGAAAENNASQGGSTQESVCVRVRLRKADLDDLSEVSCMTSAIDPPVEHSGHDIPSLTGLRTNSSGDEQLCPETSFKRSSEDQACCEITQSEDDTETLHPSKTLPSSYPEQSSSQKCFKRGLPTSSNFFEAKCISPHTAKTSSGGFSSADIENGRTLKDQEQKSQDNFGWLMKTGNVTTVDPLDTIPLTNVRAISESGVAKFELAFQQSENGPSMSKGLSNAAPMPIVVRIPDERLYVVVEYFTIVKGLSEENAHAISSSKMWYGIVEGAHRRKALINLGSKNPSHFKGYPWVVICVEWQPLHILRAFARERNEYQKTEHVVDFTVYDVLKNLKQSADDVALREGITEGRNKNRGYLIRVADHYCGCERTATKLTCQLAGIAVALSWKVIEAMGDLLNRESPDAATNNPKVVDGEFISTDARLFRNLFTKSTFRGASVFKSMASENDQLNTFERIRFLAPQRNYKSVTKNELEFQTKKAIAARKEVEKMEKKLGGHSWPQDMLAVKNSLLTTTVFDGEVDGQKGSEELLPTFLNLWKSLFPIALELQSAAANASCSPDAQAEPSTSERVSSVSEEGESENVDMKASSEEEICDSRAPGIEDDQDDDAESQGEISSKNGRSFPASHNLEDSSICDDEENELNEKVASPLERFSVRAVNIGWQDFKLRLLSEELCDFIYVDPQQSLSAHEVNQKVWTEFKDEKRIKDFANFCCLALRPGCYAFIFVLAEEFCAWSSALHAEGMQVMKAPFLIVPKSDCVRATRLKDLPQSCGELAIVAKAPGTCPGFNVNLHGTYELIGCTYKRKFGIIDNAPRCANPLKKPNSRSEVRPRERHPDLVSEIIETFCVPKGTVLDAFGGALTSAFSCISSRRPCVVLEKDTFCFELAIRRLEKACRDRLLNPEEINRSQTDQCESEDIESK